MFNVINIATGEAVLEDDGQPAQYETGKAAADTATALCISTGQKWQPRQINLDPNWREREAARFKDGTYTKLPWFRREWFRAHEIKDHFAHVSTLKSGMVAYTENDKAGQANKKVMLKPGRYLTRFYKSILTPRDIKELCALFAIKHESLGGLHITTTDDEIEEVYTLGPDSCMGSDEYRKSFRWGEWLSPFHPTRVYAAGDLQVAYMRDEKGRITGRSLVWPAKKTHSRVYGDEHKMNELLYRNGYRFAPPIGAKLRRHNVMWDHPSYGMIEVPVLPYIDRGHVSGGGALEVKKHDTEPDKFLVITSEVARDGEWSANQLNGVGHPTGRSRRRNAPSEYTCESCEDSITEDNICEVRTDGHNAIWCGSCRDSGTFYCEGSDRYYATDSYDYVEINGGMCVWEQSFFDRHGFVCDATDTNWSEEHRVLMETGDSWCQRHFEMHGAFCEKTGGAWPNDQMVEIEDVGYVCIKWAKHHGYDENGEKIKEDQLELEIEEHETDGVAA